MAVEKTTTGASEWLELKNQMEYRIDVDVPDGLTISYRMQSTDDTAEQPKTVLNPNNIAEDWDFTQSAAVGFPGPCHVRFYVDSRSGNSDPVVMRAKPTGALPPGFA